MSGPNIPQPIRYKRQILIYRLTSAHPWHAVILCKLDGHFERRISTEVCDAGPKSGTEVRGRNVIKENREYQVKKDDRNIQESVRENEKQADDPVGSEVNLKVEFSSSVD